MNVRILAASAFVFTLATSTAFAAHPHEDLHAQAKVSETDARTTALRQVPDGTIASSELEKEHGKLIWSFDIKRSGSKDITEVQVDAKSGRIVSTQVESPADQARETAADAKAPAHH